MAGKRFWITNSPYDCISTVKYQTQAASAVLETGMFAKVDGNGSVYAVASADGDSTIKTTVAFLGLVAKSSTSTATDDGVVEIYMPLPGLVYRGYATDSSAVDTAAKINLLLGDKVTLDVSATTSAGNWTIDENVGDVQTSPLHLVAGNPEKGTLDFVLRHSATFLGDIDL